MAGSSLRCDRHAPRYRQGMEVFTGVAVIYYLLAYPQALGVNWLFDKFQVKE